MQSWNNIEATLKVKTEAKLKMNEGTSIATCCQSYKHNESRSKATLMQNRSEHKARVKSKLKQNSSKSKTKLKKQTMTKLKQR